MLLAHRCTLVSLCEYIGLSDKSSKNWFSPVKIIENCDQSSTNLTTFELNLKTVYGKDEVQEGKMSSKRFGLFAEIALVHSLSKIQQNKYSPNMLNELNRSPRVDLPQRMGQMTPPPSGATVLYIFQV